MKTKILGSVLLFLTLVTQSYASITVRGNHYSGTDSDGDFYEYEFSTSGTLKYTSPSGTYSNGTWQQYKSSIFIETNGHYKVCIGIVDETSLEFKCWNKNNQFWMHTLEKK